MPRVRKTITAYWDSVCRRDDVFGTGILRQLHTVMEDNRLGFGWRRQHRYDECEATVMHRRENDTIEALTYIYLSTQLNLSKAKL